MVSDFFSHLVEEETRPEAPLANCSLFPQSLPTFTLFEFTHKEDSPKSNRLSVNQGVNIFQPKEHSSRIPTCVKLSLICV
jgi:hypothetical protein